MLSPSRLRFSILIISSVRLDFVDLTVRVSATLQVLCYSVVEDPDSGQRLRLRTREIINIVWSSSISVHSISLSRGNFCVVIDERWISDSDNRRSSLFSPIPNRTFQLKDQPQRPSKTTPTPLPFNLVAADYY